MAGKERKASSYCLLVAPSTSSNKKCCLRIVVLLAIVSIPSSAFVLKKNILSLDFDKKQARHTNVWKIIRRQYHGNNRRTIAMLRNIDLPECIVFYGTETVISLDDEPLKQPKLQPGFLRFLKEAQEIQVAVILLSENKTGQELSHLISQYICSNNNTKYLSSSFLQFRSSLEMPATLAEIEGVENEKNKCCDNHIFLVGKGYSPSPAALLDAVSSILISPRGFGGSGGFGSKYADPPRPPLAKHCVVFVTGPNITSRARCLAARAAGMRVMYIERSGLCDCEDIVDGVIPSLGEGDDGLLSLDDISTPGSFWLNPPSPRDENGNRVDPFDLSERYYEQRNNEGAKITEDRRESLSLAREVEDVESTSGAFLISRDKELFNSILADIDPL